MRLRIHWREGWAHVAGTGPDGRRVRRALGTRDPDRAEEARAAFEARLWKVGLYGPEHVVTFDEAALAYVRDGGEDRFILPIATALRGRKLASITPRDVREAARRAYPDASNATVNRQGITPARAVVNFGHEQGWCQPIRVRGFPVSPSRRRAVGRPYLDALRPHLKPELFALMLFMHTTGRRLGEAVGLDVADIDLPRLRARIGRTKNGDPAYAHLTAEVAGLLAGIMPASGPIFPWGASRNHFIYKPLRAACAKTGMPYLATHQPGRHSFATTLNDAGLSAIDIASAGGWKSPRMVEQTYVHPQSPGERAAAVFGTKLPQRRRRKG